MTARTPSEEALWNAVCAAEFVRQLAAYDERARSRRTLRNVVMDSARAVATWAVEAARDCDKDDKDDEAAKQGGAK